MFRSVNLQWNKNFHLSEEDQEFKDLLTKFAKEDQTSVINDLKTSINGLTDNEAANRLKKSGLNKVAAEKPVNPVFLLLSKFKDPLTVLMGVLIVIAFLIKSYNAVVIISIIVLISVFLSFFQEYRSSKSAEKLKEMVSINASVVRDSQEKQLPLKYLVPGDIITLAAGDMIPADVRLIQSKDLYINQAVLTGESMPVEKHADAKIDNIENILDIPNICLMGSNIQSGTATAIVFSTGKNTYLGSLSTKIIEERVLTSFDKGVQSFTWLMIHFMFIMVPLVFIINGFSKGDWVEAFFFAVSIAVGLTPEMLPMIITVNLSQGAIAMSKKKVIVKRLNSIQNFGAMDILCADKTGTITQDKVVLEKHIDLYGNESDKVILYAYLNSKFETSLKNLLDKEILNYEHLNKIAIEKNYKKVDEIPFDFNRKRMSVVVKNGNGDSFLICKGAVREVFDVSSKGEVYESKFNLDKSHYEKADNVVQNLNKDGFRVIAVAYKEVHANQNTFSVKDESDLTIIGYIAFLDPPKETAAKAIKILDSYGINIKILTGDNELVAGKICRDVGLKSTQILLGSEIDKMLEDQLATVAENVNIFAKLIPAHKEKIINALHKKGHVVGFLGDGINDALALKASDVGISVDTAADIAKESADIILLEKSLMVLGDGVLAGRKVFGNIIKYIKMGASSNFGNMFSVVGASFFLPFLPMSPIQILVNNLLYDVSQTAIPTDEVDREYLIKPRKWEIENLKKFIVLIGPISSIFDYTTYFMMLFLFNSWNNPALFHTGWFVESLATQTLIIHVIRTNRIPFIESRASLPLIFMSALIILTGIWLPNSPFAGVLGFVKLPVLYWPLLLLTLLSYIFLTYTLKSYYIKRFNIS